ncbi:MAG: hypothetical protein ABSB88_13520 [Bryobacteraceae bacterium]|jgi:hypothetical protein
MEPQPQSSGLLTALLAGALMALLVAVIFLFVQFEHLKTDLAAVQDKMVIEMVSQKHASSEWLSSQQKRIEELEEGLETTRTQSTAQARNLSERAQKEAIAYEDALAKQIAEEEAKMMAQVAAQQTEIGDLKRGLVATNATQLAALKLKGARNYLDVKLTREDGKKRFADIVLLLKSVDPKKNTYSVDVMADDKLIEKKDKSVNEPVQFYTAKGGRTPYELVINQVGKDEIVGYLSTPKEAASR